MTHGGKWKNVYRRRYLGDE